MKVWFHDRRFMLIIGALLGIGLGLIAGWLVWPVSYYDTDVYDLHPDYQDEFVVMVGAVQSLELDPGIAGQLLSLLSNPNEPRSIETIVIDVTERYIARGANPTDVRYLVGLAQALGSVTTPMQPYLNDTQP